MLLVDATNAADYLRQNGRLAANERVSVQPLSGGVSNEVLYIARHDVAGGDFVFKQARPQLRTRDAWFCTVDRIWREVEVLRLCSELLDSHTAAANEPLGDGLRGAVGSPPLAVGTSCVLRTPSVQSIVIPEVLFEDRDNYAFGMTAAPRDHRVWKQDLLSGRSEPRIADACGRLLGRLHARSWRSADVARRLDDRQVFEELRLDPYYRTVAARHPDFAARLDDLVQSVRDNRLSLVHADFSPKNLLVFDGGLMLVDFETGHFGDPAFDLGFFTSHLVLKAFFHAPQHEPFLKLVERYIAAYVSETAGAMRDEASAVETRGVANLAGCAWARLDGKSTVEYLNDERRREQVRGLCRAILSEPMRTWSEVLSRVRHILEPNT